METIPFLRGDIPRYRESLRVLGGPTTSENRSEVTLRGRFFVELLGDLPTVVEGGRSFDQGHVFPRKGVV